MRIFFTTIFFYTILFSYSQDFQKHILYLASDSLHGRAPGTNDEMLAAKYISIALPKSKFNIKHQSFSFLVDSIKTKNATNLICSLNKNRTNDSTIILVAHYDHLVMGSLKSLEILQSKKQQIHNGADDNASGVAMVIELGKWLAKQKNKKYNIILLFTSAHEAGLFGAESFVKSNNIEALKIKTVFNFDMVGRLDNSSKILSVSDNKLDSSFYNTNTLNFSINDVNIIAHSDLKYFVEYPIHLINFTTGTHEDYHRISDDEIKINYEGMKLIYEYIQQLLRKLNK